MTASDHLQQALFHATVHPFAPGDVINPTDVEHDETPHAYATTDLGIAQSIAKMRTRMHNRRNPEDQREEKVYEVEHMSGPADIYDVPRSLRAVADPQGFRVKRAV